MNNKKLGDDFENEFVELLNERNFWVHRIAQKSEGQPADVIAVKYGKPFLIDCKYCSNDVFDTSRIEENQYYAMTKFNGSCLREIGGRQGGAYLAIKLSNGNIYMLDALMFSHIERQGYKSLDEEHLIDLGYDYEEWMGMI
jgi:Holliday junction resolvase